MGTKPRQKKRVFKVDIKSQTFSMDILIALGVFIVGILVFLYLIGGSSETQTVPKLQAESELLPQSLISPDEVSSVNSTIVFGNKVDAARLNKSINTNYSALKNTIGMVSDFCIHMEDESGVLKDLDEDPCWVQYSYGDPRLQLLIDVGGTERYVACGNRTYIC